MDLDAVLRDVRKDLAARIAGTGAEVTVEPLGRVSGNAKQLRQVIKRIEQVKGVRRVERLRTAKERSQVGGGRT